MVSEVAAQLFEVARNLNVGHLILLLQFGNMKKGLAKYNTQLFAARVMPQLGDVFSEWEDRWWPKPMEPRRAPRCRDFSLPQWPPSNLPGPRGCCYLCGLAAAAASRT
jgi:hypothetical protein